MVTSCLKATMLAKTSGSMFPVWEKFSKRGKDITQHAIQESNVTEGGILNPKF